MTRTQMDDVVRYSRALAGCALMLALLAGPGCDVENPIDDVQPARGFYSVQTTNFVSTCDTADSGRQFMHFVRIFGTTLAAQIVYENEDGACETFALERTTEDTMTWTREESIESESGACTMRRTWVGELADLGGGQLQLEDSWSWEIEEGDPGTCAAEFADLDAIPCSGSETGTGMTTAPGDWPGCF